MHIHSILKRREEDVRIAYQASTIGGKWRDHYRRLNPNDNKTFPPPRTKAELRADNKIWLDSNSAKRARLKAGLNVKY